MLYLYNDNIHVAQVRACVLVLNLTYFLFIVLVLQRLYSSSAC